MTRKAGWPVRVKLPTLPPEWQAGDAVREARPVRTKTFRSERTGYPPPLAGCQLPSALVSGWVSRAARLRMQNISPARSRSRILASAGCEFSSVTLPFRVLAASSAKTRTGPDAPAATDTSSKLTALSHGHGQA